jgi:serine/threonine protein kinase
LHKNKIVLGDLGLARDAEMMSRTSLAKGVGTVSYMAPELCDYIII